MPAWKLPERMRERDRMDGAPCPARMIRSELGFDPRQCIAERRPNEQLAGVVVHPARHFALQHSVAETHRNVADAEQRHHPIDDIVR